MIGGSLPERLRSALAGPLPGHDAFLALSGYKRPPAAEGLLAEGYRESAVLIAVYPRHGQAHTLLMRRPEYGGVHAGQVSFPGGRREPGDTDLRHTALREFREETGIVDLAPDILGTLTTVVIPPSRSVVTPFVAWCDALGGPAPDPHEVAELIEVPLGRLLQDDVVRHGEQRLSGSGLRVSVPYFDLNGNQVWGATALMLAELRELLRR